MNKTELIKNLCYTELVYERINKKLDAQYTKEQIEKFLLKVLHETSEKFFLKTGKNYYITNTEHCIRITINSNTFRVITVDKIQNVRL